MSLATRPLDWIGSFKDCFDYVEAAVSPEDAEMRLRSVHSDMLELFAEVWLFSDDIKKSVVIKEFKNDVGLSVMSTKTSLRGLRELLDLHKYPTDMNAYAIFELIPKADAEFLWKVLFDDKVKDKAENFTSELLLKVYPIHTERFYDFA